MSDCEAFPEVPLEEILRHYVYKRKSHGKNVGNAILQIIGKYQKEAENRETVGDKKDDDGWSWVAIQTVRLEGEKRNLNRDAGVAFR